AVTYQDVVKLLRSGKGEDEILDILKKSPVETTFTLGEDQVKQLKKMRVSDEFIAALKSLKKPTAPGSDITDFVVILDCSGSMIGLTPDGKTKMDAAKKATTELIERLPNGLRVAF